MYERETKDQEDVEDRKSIRWFADVSRNYPASVTRQSAALSYDYVTGTIDTDPVIYLYQLFGDEKARGDIATAANTAHELAGRDDVNHMTDVDVGVILLSEIIYTAHMIHLHHVVLLSLRDDHADKIERARKSYFEKKYMQFVDAAPKHNDILKVARAELPKWEEMRTDKRLVSRKSHE